MSVFSTERPVSIEATMEQAQQARLEREINMNMLRAQRELEQQAILEQASMEKDSYNAKDEAEKQARLEQIAQTTRVEKSRKALIEATTNMAKNSRRYLFGNLLTYIVTESLWVDDEFKNTDEAAQMISEAVDEIIGKCETVTGQKLMEGTNHSKLLSYADVIIADICSRATDRILLEAATTGEAEINFSLNDEESEELYDKLSDLNPEQIAQTIKNKVLDTIKDEKECGQVKAELFKELDDASSEEPESEEGEEPVSDDTVTDETEDDANEVAESLVGSPMDLVVETIKGKEGTHRGYDIRVLLKLADKEARNNNFDNASACYTKAAQLCESLRNLNRTMFPTEFAFVKGSIDAAMESRMFNISRTSGEATIRTNGDGYTARSLNDALIDLRTYCGAMSTAVTKRNIVTETLNEKVAKRKIERINDVLNGASKNSLFEALMFSNIKKLEASNPVTESGARMIADEIENAAMINTVLEYTIFETLNTLKLFDFNMRTIDKLKTM